MKARGQGMVLRAGHRHGARFGLGLPIVAAMAWLAAAVAPAAIAGEPPLQMASSDPSLATTVDPRTLSPSRRTRSAGYLTAKEAAAAVAADPDIVLIDVRTAEELAGEGTPAPADAHIPYIVSFGTGERNADFDQDVMALLGGLGLDRDQPVVLICRSGARSAAAANLLTEAGFTEVYTIADGTSGSEAGPGWKRARAPWTRDLPATLGVD